MRSVDISSRHNSCFDFKQISFFLSKSEMEIFPKAQ